MIEKIHKDIQTNLRKYNQDLVDMKPQEMLHGVMKSLINNLLLQQVLVYSHQSF